MNTMNFLLFFVFEQIDFLKADLPTAVNVFPFLFSFLFFFFLSVDQG